MVMSIHRLPVMGYSLAANMTNDSWLLIISPSSDPRSCICHLDRNCPIRPLLYSALLKASFYCQVKKWLISPPSTSVRRVKMDQWTVMAKVFFPTIVSALSDRKNSLGTYFAANLTICLLARSPTATSACTLNCCWRKTKKHCFPESKTTIDRARFLQYKHNSLVRIIPWALCLKLSRFVQSKGLCVTWDECLTAVGIRWSVKHLQTEPCLWRALCGERLIATFLSNIYRDLGRV